MFEIKGKYSSARVYAQTVEQGAIEQIQAMCDQEFTQGSRIRMMPDVERVDEAAHFIPSGRNVWEGREPQPGQAGGGILPADGSGAAPGEKAYFRERDAMIEAYKAAGRRNELQTALKALKWKPQPLTVPEDLCWLYGSYLEDYLHDVEICQEFAKRNRELITEILLDRVGIKAGEAFHTVHNYIDTEERILRKGAVSARKGERLLIPVNMRDGSILALGKGNPEWNYSAPHGAGRVMSRADARQTLNMETYRQTMEGIYTTSVNEDTLDESPMAYKSLEELVGIIGESVDIIDVMKPVYNYKHSGQ